MRLYVTVEWLLLLLHRCQVPGSDVSLTTDCCWSVCMWLSSVHPVNWWGLFDWLHFGLGPHGPDAPRPYITGPLCSMSIYGSPVTLLKFQMAPKLILLISSGSKKGEPRYMCLTGAKASHSQSMWAKVSSFTPHLLRNRLSSSLRKWRCLLRVLCLVSGPVTTLDWVMSKDKNFALMPRLGPEIEMVG
jgi:hypothetical protein